MVKTPTCKSCKQDGHYAINCRTTARKPIKTSKLVKTKLRSTVKTAVKRRQKSRSQLVRQLDSVFSTYIRQKEAIDGIGRCVTCGDTKPWQQLQNGHFYTRGRYHTRWDEDNCHTQCVTCNVFKKGNYINYTMYMIDRYGRDFVNELEIKSKSKDKILTTVIQEMIEHYR